MSRPAVYAGRLYPSGGWELSAMIDGYRVSECFFGYSKREAIAIFRDRNGI